MLRRVKNRATDATTNSGDDKKDLGRPTRPGHKPILYIIAFLAFGTLLLFRTSPSPVEKQTSQEKPPKPRLFTPPPISRKLFCGSSFEETAFFLKGYKKTKDCKNAAFIALQWLEAQIFRNSEEARKALRPWNRPNWLSGNKFLGNKDLFFRGMKERNIRFPFFPETYELGDASDRKAFLERLQDKAGMDTAWVFKDVKKDGFSRGVTLVGPRSPQLEAWKDRLLLAQDGDIDQDKYIIAQKYVSNLLTYQGRKFVRAHFIVASADPPLVYYHDGYLPMSPVVLNQTGFGGDTDLREMHSSSPKWGGISPDVVKRSYVSFGTFDKYLRSFVANKTTPISKLSDPLNHIRNQMKDAGAQVFAAFRDRCFDIVGFPFENGYQMLGADFFVDEDLRAWMIEVNTWVGSVGSPAGHDEASKMLSEMADVLSEIYEKQLHGEAIWPLKSVAASDVFYRDDF